MSSKSSFYTTTATPDEMVPVATSAANAATSEANALASKNAAESAKTAAEAAQAASEDVPTNSTAAIPNPINTAMGPSTIHDRRRKKDKMPVLLKRFRKYIEDNYG